MEDEEIVDRRARIADFLGECIRGLHRKARAKQPVVECDIAGRHGARRRVLDHLAEAEVFEEMAGAFAHRAQALAAIASASATVRRAISACSSSTIRPSTVITPFPAFSGCAKAATIFLACATSVSAGE